MGTLQAGTGCPRYPGPLPSPASIPAVGVLLGLEGEATDAEVVRAVLAGGGGGPGRAGRGCPPPAPGPPAPPPSTAPEGGNTDANLAPPPPPLPPLPFIY